MKFETRKYQIIGNTPILGSQPASNEIREQYLCGKEDESDHIDEDKGVSVFYEDPKTGAPMMMDYQIRGFLKAAGRALSKQLNLAAPASKIDQFVFVKPRFIPIVDDDGKAIEEIETYERPLRANTMQGPRVALASSEMINTPWNIFIEIMVIENEKTAKSGAITFDIIEELLSYGYYSGLGQFRNGGFGQFDFKRL